MVNVQLQKPSGGTFEQRLQPGLCIGKCVDITDAPAGQFGDNMYWWWEVYYTGEKGAKDLVPASFNEDGSIYRLRDMTSTKFGKGKTADKTAKARVRVEALLKREIDDDEPLDGLLDQCIGKPALLYLAANEAGYLNVQLCQPYKPGTLAPIPAAVAVASDDDETPDDSEDVPF
jgi:hypothetical protein